MLSRLTIAIPTHDRNDYLVRLLQSISPDFKGEVVVSDNGSYVTESIRSNYPSFNFISIRDKVQMFQNWNFAIDNIKTEWFIMPSDDDLFCADSFQAVEDALKEYPDADILFFGHNVIDQNDLLLSSWKPVEKLSFNSPQGFHIFAKGIDARCPSIVFRTDLVRKLGKFDESFEFTAADSLLIQKCLLYGKSVFIPEIISAYRVWPNNFTSQLIGTKRWLDKIQKWTDDIELILKTDFPTILQLNKLPNLKDQIFATNLIGGLLNMRKKQGLIAALNFVFQNRYPFHADIKTQLHIIKAIVIG